MKPATHEQQSDREHDYRKHEAPKTPIFILAVEHKYGTNLSAHSSHRKALAALISYVNECWTHETGLTDKTKPSSNDELVTAYFEALDGRENYEISETTLD